MCIRDRNIITAGDKFIENPMERPFMPTWNRVVSAIPDIFEQLVEAVELDHQEYSTKKSSARPFKKATHRG